MLHHGVDKLSLMDDQPRVSMVIQQLSKSSPDLRATCCFISGFLFETIRPRTKQPNASKTRCIRNTYRRQMLLFLYIRCT